LFTVYDYENSRQSAGGRRRRRGTVLLLASVRPPVSPGTDAGDQQHLTAAAAGTCMCKEPKIAGGGGMDEPAGSGRAGASRQLDRPHCVLSDRRRRAAEAGVIFRPGCPALSTSASKLTLSPPPPYSSSPMQCRTGKSMS